MSKVEYKVVRPKDNLCVPEDFDFEKPDYRSVIKKTLDDYADEGWELTSDFEKDGQRYYIFKREKKS